MKLNHLFWGIFLIVLGGLILLNTYTNFSLEFDSIINFWPLVLILIGLKILIRNKLMGSLIVIISAIFLALVFYYFLFENITCRTQKFYHDTDKEKREIISQNFLPSIKKAYLNIDYNLGDFKIDTDTEKLIEGEIIFRKDKYRFDGEILDSIADYRLKSEAKNPIFIFENKRFNHLNLSLNVKPEWYLKFTSNFVEHNINLHQINLSSLDIGSNFSMGSFRVVPQNKFSKIKLETNFSSLKIQIPDSIGVELFIDKNFSSIKINDFEKVLNNHLKSKNFDDKKSHIQLVVKANFSKITIEN